ncbi:S-norcoclaurine synthase 2-like isoform X2 [Sesamum indicum]|uniref:S-norcoclaurine synthase 2-like isoform X2 n=1 Tax=Sesamum indicum TaxID=4182 RepID=A0A6I9TGT3_SESIN|nr:S-norcoclaurine synthase 2-like isoform X2 [Sesamum indicum]
MVGRLSEEIEVKVPAVEAWKLYSTLQLAKIVGEALPNFISKIDVIQGDGSAGTILHLFFAPGRGGPSSYKEKFTVVDDERRVKETEVVEGGFLDLGFTLYRVRFEVIEKEGNKEECVTRSTVEYELKEEAAANAALVSIEPLVAVMKVAADYLTKNYNNN